MSTKSKKTKEKTMLQAHFLLLLDKSGSMANVVDTTIKGADELIDSIAEASKENHVKSTVSVITFDDIVDIEDKLMYKDPAKIGSLKSHYHIRGGTSIYDALGTGLSQFNAPENAVVVLFTDGGEGGSKDYNNTSTGALVKAKKDAGWTIAYVSPTYNCETFATGISIPKGNVLKYESGNTGTRTAFSKLGRAAERYIVALANSSKKDTTKFFSGLELDSEMKVKDMQVVLNMPRALKSKKNGDEEVKQELPPSYPVEAYVVDEYPNCPANWMHGSSKASSYFVGVKEGRGMWLDFNGCNKDYDVAAVVSIQGVNPITGQKSDKLRLERYENKCPIHEKDFQQDRFCPDCGYKWPTQNYLATTGTPDGQFWLDGFRSEDGKIRQYIFTEEMARGVANAVIGTDRVFAIGIAFFKSKKKKPIVMHDSYGGGLESMSFMRSMTKGMVSTAQYSLPRPAGMGGRLSMRSTSRGSKGAESINLLCSVGGAGGASASAYAAPSAAMPVAASMGSEETAVMDFCSDSDSDSFLESLTSAPMKSYEVGAGAAIDQKVHDDKESLDYWETEPAGFIYVNYTDENTVKNILAAGKRKEKKEGFLAAVPVGN